MTSPSVSSAPDLRYPIGRADMRTPLEAGERAQRIDAIAATPAQLRQAVAGLSDAQLDTPYRPGGWTVRQVVHHVPESHMNAYIRMKLAATEDVPTIKTYEEQLWAELPDVKSCPVDVSLTLLDALHRRWVTFLRTLPESDLSRPFVHPTWGRVPIDEAIGMYAWHCRHHTAHIENALAVARA